VKLSISYSDTYSSVHLSANAKASHNCSQ